MTMRKMNKIIILSLTFIISMFLFTGTSRAAADITVSAGSTTLTTGGTTTLTVSISGGALGGAGDINISSSDSSVVSISGGTTAYLKPGSTTHPVTLTANKAGTAVITVKYNVADYETETEKKSSKTVTITVKDPAPVTPPPSNNPVGGNTGPAKSGDATLKSITVAGKKQTSPKTDFTINVDSGLTSAEISAETNHSGARVSGTGTKELATGTNTVVLTVTAENGATKTYTIRIRKLAPEGTTPNVSDNPNTTNNQEPTNDDQNAENPEEGNEENKLRLSYLMIDDAELMPAFDSEIFEYSLYVTNKESLNVVAQANMEDANVEVIGADELVDGDNDIIIKLTKGEETVEYKIRVNKTTEEVIMPGTVDNGNQNGGGMSTGTTIGIGVRCGCSMLRTCRIMHLETKIKW